MTDDEILYDVLNQNIFAHAYINYDCDYLIKYFYRVKNDNWNLKLEINNSSYSTIFDLIYSKNILRRDNIIMSLYKVDIKLVKTYLRKYKIKNILDE